MYGCGRGDGGVDSSSKRRRPHNLFRFLAELDQKDSTTKVEEAARAMDYFMQGPKVGGGGQWGGPGGRVVVEG